MNLQIFPENLAADRKNQFDAVGYCVVDGLWSEDQLQEIENFFEDYKYNGRKVFDHETSFDEIDMTQRQVRAMQPHRYSRQALEWLINPRVGKVLELLLGKPPLVAQSMYYFKPPGAKGQGMHQDNFYLIAQPATWHRRVDGHRRRGPWTTAASMSCPDRTAATSAARTAARSTLGWSTATATSASFRANPNPCRCRCAEGQTMFFGGNLIHGSGPNRTKDRSRRTFIGHYADNASQTLAKYYHPVLNMQGEVCLQRGSVRGWRPVRRRLAGRGALRAGLSGGRWWRLA